MMKKVFVMTLAAMAMVPALCRAQDGTDISTAIPVYFGQTISDTVDGKTRPNQVYSIALAKGQQLAATLTASDAIALYLGDSSVHALGNATWTKTGSNNGQATQTLTYQVATAGIYYVVAASNRSGVSYKLQVTAQGTILPTATCTATSTLSGQVDYMIYSLGLVSAGLPDEVSIGGNKLCATCSSKPPAYPELVGKLENSMGLNLNVSAGFDANGNMCQIKLVRP